jgi:hypothetical protein
MLSQLLKFDLRHGHEGVDFVLRALEILNAKGIDGHHLDASLVANLQYLVHASAYTGTIDRTYPYSSKGLKPQIMPFYSFDVVIPGKPPVAVHNECDMLWNRALLQGANEQLSQLSHSPCNRR